MVNHFKKVPSDEEVDSHAQPASFALIDGPPPKKQRVEQPPETVPAVVQRGSLPGSTAVQSIDTSSSRKWNF